MSVAVQRSILEKIRSAPFYAIMGDETTDMSQTEEMSINIRIVDETLTIFEYFLGFYATPFTDSETLFKVVQDVLVRSNLPLHGCRGQCYDGANCVSGWISGLQRLFRNKEPRAFYTHCAGHNLNLVAQDGMKTVKAVANFLSEMKELVTFVRGSAKRLEIFKQIQLEGDSDDEDDVDSCSETRFTNLKSFCVTRWCVRVKSLKSIRANYKAILKFCDKIGNENSDAGIKSRGFTNKLNKFETCLYVSLIGKS